MAWPNSNKATAKSSNTKAPVNTKNQETQAQTSHNNTPPLEDAPICAGTSWPKAGRMFGNLFEIRKDWLIPPNNNANDKNSDTAASTNPKPPIKLEPQNQETPKAEKCGWGQNCPICKREEEDWNGDHWQQFLQTSNDSQSMNQTTSQDPQPTQTESFDVPEKYMEQIHLRREWGKKMERLNKMYNLDCFLSSELDSESDEGEDYRFQHHYETLI